MCGKSVPVHKTHAQQNTWLCTCKTADPYTNGCKIAYVLVENSWQPTFYWHSAAEFCPNNTLTEKKKKKILQGITTFLDL